MPQSEDIVMMTGRTSSDGSLVDSPVLRAWLKDVQANRPGIIIVNGVEIFVSEHDTPEDIIRKHKKGRKQQS